MKKIQLKNHIVQKSFHLFSIALALSATQVYASCGSAYCTLNTNWGTQGVWTDPGMRLDLRYENINQDQVIGTADATEDHREIKTENNNFQATMDYTLNDRLGISLSLPVVKRKHEHWHINGADQELETWNFSKLGDAKIIGRLNLSDTQQHDSGFGVQLGFKLPTGDDKIKNEAGELAERSLQPGTGTTDIISGVYYFQQMPALKSRWFVQLQYAHPLNEKNQFKSGNNFVTDLGYAYNANATTSLIVQLNYLNKSRDWGDQAEPENSGGHTLSLSPGVNYSIAHNTHIYAFIHHRLSQDLNGSQLSAKNSYVVGASFSF